MEETITQEVHLMMEIFTLFAIQNIPPILETLALFSLLIYAAMIVGAVVIVVSIWRGMRAHERMADSMERMADATEMIEKFVKRDGEPRA
jgi:hypothetical protein